MPTERQFEEAAVEFCLSTSVCGVWPVHTQQVDINEFDVTIRLGSHYRGEPAGLATIHVIYDPALQEFLCYPVRPLLPDTWQNDLPSYQPIEPGW